MDLRVGPVQRFSPPVHRFSLIGTAAFLLGTSPITQADEVHIAVAANFTRTLQTLEPMFEDRTGHQLTASYASTGKLYALITNGAPYEVFLSADQAHSQRLIREGMAVAGSEFTYALGQLSLWCNDHQAIPAGKIRLLEGKFRKLAIANPKTAPYGQAAMETLQYLGIDQQLTPLLVFGENIGQAYQFVFSGNADCGLVAQAYISANPELGSYWQVPADYYQPLKQEAVLLARGKASPAAEDFLAFLRSPDALAVIHSQGYGLSAVTEEPTAP